MKTLRFALYLPLLALGTLAMAQGGPSLPGGDLEVVTEDQIRPMARICENCHGAGGQTTRVDIPSIAGKPADFILSTLEQFYYYERHCPDVEYENAEGKLEKKSMCDITNAMNKQEAMALARYFESRPPADSTDE